MNNILNKYSVCVLAFCSLLNYSAMSQTSKRPLKVGDTMPSFSLYDQDGKLFNSADHIGKNIMVVYFYPKDESMVCTKEACAFRNSFDQFNKVDAMVIGINAGTVASHKAFQQHYKLPFTLLSDPDNKVYDLFGVSGKLFLGGRETYVIDMKGKIVYIHDAMLEGQAHADESLKFIQAAKMQ